MTHSIIPPSSAGIWGKPDGCTGWVLMNQLYPESEERPEAAEGTASHWVASEVLESYRPGAPSLITCQQLAGETSPNGVVITEEIADGADLYVKDVLQVCQERGLLGSLAIEQHIQIPRVHDLSHGTCDCYIWDKANGELFIWDYKFGYEVVEAFENWQSINYLAGIFDECGIDGLKDQHVRVNMRIAQPRAYHREGLIREWKVLASDLRAHFNILKSNADKALGPNATFNTGSHCKHCPGRHACLPAIEAGAKLYEAASAPTPVEMSNDAMGVQLSIIKRAKKHLESLESGFEEQIKSKLYAGQNVLGWATEPSFGREKFDRPYDEIVAMGDMLGKDLRKKVTVTPKQAIKLGVDEAVIKEYSIKTRTGLALVPDNGNKAKQVFTK